MVRVRSMNKNNNKQIHKKPEDDEDTASARLRSRIKTSTGHRNACEKKSCGWLVTEGIMTETRHFHNGFPNRNRNRYRNRNRNRNRNLSKGKSSLITKRNDYRRLQRHIWAIW
jgi:hypothetical protein